ncbi:lysophospholipid acyltransferase family protein [Shewanella surugensis]|uniref:Lysophospholipid acyltransferase family protein n=1 Tax=Shewanella surugensis TaxID=212020 RepID=A0ABT0LA54_9GAMM|nr:lysophospholipid acyltransferase family protein [Shewanella surugensis]MCL1124041.1 lysophospholipid acyltransferase family protein [Shewanella surugensis]
MFQKFFYHLLKLIGWDFVGELPKQPQYVIIVAPHTSNWDFIIGLIARNALGEQIYFLGKHQLFIPPWGWFFRAFGGAPVDRNKCNNLVEGATLLFKNNPNFKLALTPEGTRGKVSRWKTGFYHIANQAKVPIVTVGFDFSLKKVIIADGISPSGNIETDMEKILHFHRSIKGFHPKEIPDFKT